MGAEHCPKCGAPSERRNGGWVFTHDVDGVRCREVVALAAAEARDLVRVQGVVAARLALAGFTPTYLPVPSAAPPVRADGTASGRLRAAMALMNSTTRPAKNGRAAFAPGWAAFLASVADPGQTIGDGPLIRKALEKSRLDPDFVAPLITIFALSVDEPSGARAVLKFLRESMGDSK